MAIKEIPEGITPVMIEGVLMPNGEVITLGKTIGWFDTFKEVMVIVE